MKKNSKKKKGFTLVELIAVIAILGILAAIIVPKVGNFTSQANTTRTKSNAAIVLNAIELYNAQASTDAERIGDSKSDSVLVNPKISDLIDSNDKPIAKLDQTAGVNLAETISKLDSKNDADKAVLNANYNDLLDLVKNGTTTQ